MRAEEASINPLRGRFRRRPWCGVCFFFGGFGLLLACIPFSLDVLAGEGSPAVEADVAVEPDSGGLKVSPTLRCLGTSDSGIDYTVQVEAEIEGNNSRINRSGSLQLGKDMKRLSAIRVGNGKNGEFSVIFNVFKDGVKVESVEKVGKLRSGQVKQ